MLGTYGYACSIIILNTFSFMTFTSEAIVYNETYVLAQYFTFISVPLIHICTSSQHLCDQLI